MKKTIAVAALLAASFTLAPVVPAQAASAYPAHCIVLPLLQADCRDVIRDNINTATERTRTAATRAATPARTLKLPVTGPCTRAPAGSGHLYDC